MQNWIVEPGRGLSSQVVEGVVTWTIGSKSPETVSGALQTAGGHPKSSIGAVLMASITHSSLSKADLRWQ